MNNQQNRDNFNKCLAFIKERIGLLNGRSLCIGYGEADYSHPWLKEEFHNRKFSLQINNNFDDLPIVVEWLSGGTYVPIYGYEKDSIDRFRKSYKGTGMAYPDYRYTWDDLDVVPFLLDWKHIKEEFLSAIAEYENLKDFEV